MAGLALRRKRVVGREELAALFALSLLPLAVTTAASVEDSSAELRAAYERALRVAPWSTRPAIRNADPRVRWIDDGEHLWHFHESDGRDRFLVRESRSGRVIRDVELAALGWIGEQMQAPVGRADFARMDAELSAKGRVLQLYHAGRSWICDLEAKRCTVGPRRAAIEEKSPDGRYAAFVRDHDIWVRDLQHGDERALTTDGVDGHGYGSLTEQVKGIIFGVPFPEDAPIGVIWSPDSKRLVVARVDETRVPAFPIVEHAPRDRVAPGVHSYRYNFLTQNPQIFETLWVLDVRGGPPVQLRVETQPLIVDSTPFLKRVWWRPDSRELAVAIMDPEDRWVDVYKIDPDSGAARRLFREQERYRIRLTSLETALAPSVRLLSNGDLLWYSHRSGRGHLHRVDGRTGEFRQPITSGDWVVHSLLHLDEQRRLVYFTAGGVDPRANPYYASVFRIGLDGSDLRRLTPELAHHQLAAPPIGFRRSSPAAAAFSPNGRYFIDTRSTPRDPEVTLLREASGRVVAEIARAELVAAVANARVLPEAFAVPAPEGAEALHGLMFFPANFDPRRRYPVIDAIYNGQQTVETPRNFSQALLDGAQATAELGFVVVVMDARGTPQRSLAFHDFAAAQRDQVGSIGDHVHAIRRLAATRPYMDLERVGIYGVSNGGYAALRAMLAYPDFFKVGVSINGSHDLRKYIPHGGINWVQRNGHDSLAAALEPVANQNFVNDLRGRLLLIVGGMDANAPIGNSFGVAQALIDAGRNFDLVFVPAMGHSYRQSPFAVRKLWDFLVLHLLGRSPPEDLPLR